MTFIDKSATPNTPIVRGSGSTDSERRLAKLADIAFLKLWSYPNPHRIETTNNRRECKEICDLLVVCQNHVILFSDKSINWGGTDDKKSWSRWARKAILKSKKQMLGAVGWIDKNPSQIYTDRKCKSPLPIDLPPCESRKFHLVLVTEGSEAACQRRYNGTSGSLIIRPSVVELANWDANETEFRPFHVGDVNLNGQFIHVFDSVSLTFLMSELDTVVDFTNYLNRRETYLRSGHLLEAHGEENLFASYISRVTEEGEHDFSYDPAGAPVTIQRGRYEQMIKKREYKLKKERDKASYFWDALIAKFSKHVFDDTLLAENEELARTADAEKGLRLMALETRLSRRMYGDAFRGALEKGNEGPIFKRLVIDPDTTKVDVTAFLALTCKHEREMGGYAAYIEIRQKLLLLYTREELMRHPNVKRIVGIAFEPSQVTHDRSETMLYHEQMEWTDEQREEVQSNLNVLCRFASPPSRRTYKEYPDVYRMNTGPDDDDYSPPSMNRKARRANAAKTRRKR